MKKFAIIGYGGMGSWHAEKARNSDVVSLAGIYDIREERRAHAESKGIHAFASEEEILSDPEIEFVTIATPNDFHKPIALRALAAGKNVISEKPVTLSSSDLEEMFEASYKAKKLFTVHQNRRWDADFLSIKEIYDSGVLGRILNIESRVQGSHGIPGDWRKEKEHGGGMVLDWGVHLIDQMLMLVPSKIGKLSCVCEHITNFEVDEGFKLDLYFENGQRARIEVETDNFISLPRWYMRGVDGTTMINGWNLDTGKSVICNERIDVGVVPVKTAAGLTKTMAPRNEKTVRTEPVPHPTPDVHDFYRNFCRAIDGKEEQIVTHKQMMRVMKLMEAMFVSDSLGGQLVDFE